MIGSSDFGNTPIRPRGTMHDAARLLPWVLDLLSSRAGNMDVDFDILESGRFCERSGRTAAAAFELGGGNAESTNG
jgi:hypothetical protein